MRRIYMDHNATTPLHPDVLETMRPFLTEKFGNASSIHFFGRETRVAVDEAREIVAHSLGAKPSEIFFTSGGTESDNLAIKGSVHVNGKDDHHIVSSKIEHHAVLHTCQSLEKEGFRVTYVSVDRNGMVDPDAVAEAITEHTILVTIMHANNEVGSLQPIKEIGAICREKGVSFHTDAVQSFGKIPVDVNDVNVDLLSLSGHKLYGPKGIGALYIRKGKRITPLFHGGSHERNRRAGTENVAGIVGLGKAIQIAMDSMESEAKNISELRDTLMDRLAEKIEHIHLNGHPMKRLPGTLNVSFAGIEGESIVLSLDLKGIAVSSGSACTSGALEPSHVLAAMGLSSELAQGSIRFSLGRENAKRDVDYVVQVLPEIIERLRAMSPMQAV
ncbi:MAG: cysteine desulfurase NifS [Gemmatimonadota bacterium]|nr:MAG: cysteine desulfurase NifS [Gemmatimonadota bacterium]